MATLTCPEASMLREKPSQRPNIYQVVREVAAIRGTDIPIQDVWASPEVELLNADLTRSTPPEPHQRFVETNTYRHQCPMS